MYFSSKKLLQLGLAFVFIYAGVSMLVHPQDWIGFVPPWLEFGFITRELFLYANGLLEILLASAFLLGRWQKQIGWFAFLHLLLIVFVNGESGFLITFRDVGLSFSALAYAYIKT
ncbi:MAG: hypothetical protein A3F94_00615 [Candidatus Spechtbacteria bacterium RIFCSPLOWO2_12_FULL_38_22]|uniref:DoxX family protein n=1 Tax=Candidatus Spechtbacteria bacterium RIFCSPLOWO2_12_FULL_38_22 TaxID=1802165 RepID=A0A1G2HHC1_9BACT|nr:MAG: hypothetical protein A2728_02820 [Candidatus Spechtbacteria bacterium RIFCSPHIGHO2_01_FULL_38_11]OGZ59628.1 MAG: hypothetical protein A3A00_00305 [Candidatus Spechtbacteria bacterium RIFCSPLOWO2_01_FULL_38_20]OGZ60028.1 MAG: hypothetical protein A3E58_01630 [Candidatus Spechtbacteria bacterium RIFCSPHIGHO2_12_FULL_38_30]OGZ61896.1 MAG: hypothetical protein A3F94_00615 [Candidatus Spechtbacteria bacterium RIFCSPLOWO2_12_FULL_38_22]